MAEGESIPEAEAMKDYLVICGLDDKRIITECQSRSTYENLVLSKAVLQDHIKGEYQVLIVSSDYHIFRTSLMAKKLGYSASYLAAKTRWYEYPYRVARECIAIGKLILLGC